MSNQVYSNDSNPYWLSSTGIDQIYTNKLSNPPLGILGKGVLYELTDGNLYFNGNNIGPSPVGTVTGPGSSVTNDMVLFADTTGKVISDSNIKIFSDVSKTSLALGSAIANQTDNQSNTIVGYGALTTGAGVTNTVCVGKNAGQHLNTNDNHSAYVGTNAGVNAVGPNNTIIGDSAGSVAGSTNTYVGKAAGATITGNNNICLGATVDGLSADANKMRLGTALITDTYIGGIYNNHTFDAPTVQNICIDTNNKIINVPSMIMGGFRNNASFNVATVTQNVQNVLGNTTTFFGNSTYFNNAPTSGIIQYTGTQTLPALIIGTMNVTLATNTDIWTLAIYKNSTTVIDLRTISASSANMSTCVNFSYLDTMATSDNYKFVFTNTTSTGGINFLKWNITVQFGF